MPPPSRKLLRSATQQDIAAALNLSRSTVAFALNPKHRAKLQPETVCLVESKARELRYHPKRFAQLLRGGQSHTIGVIFGSALYHAPQERVRCLAKSAMEVGYDLVAVDLDWFASDTERLRRYLLDNALEGLVMCNVNPTHPVWSLVEEESNRLPVVSIGGLEIGNFAASDLLQAYELMTRHHLAQQSRNLVLLLSYHDEGADYSKAVPSVLASRIEGFCRAIEAAGGSVEVSKDCHHLFDLPLRAPKARSGIVGRVMHPLREKGIHNVFELGNAITTRMIEEGNLPDSLICSNDEIAAGALTACIRKQIPVPGRVCISGTDNATFSPFCGIPLTTLSQPSEQMAQWVISRIVELIEKPKQRAKHHYFPCELLLRDSTQRTAPNP